MLQKIIVLLVLITSFDSLAARRDPNAEIQFIIRSDKPGAVYKLGEEAVFSVQVSHKDKKITSGFVTVRLSYDNGSEIFKTERAQLSDTPLLIRGTLNKPGFLRCDVSYTHNGKTFSDRGAAAFEPKKLKAVAEEPPKGRKSFATNL